MVVVYYKRNANNNSLAPLTFTKDVEFVVMVVVDVEI